MRYWLFHYIFQNIEIYKLNFFQNFDCVIIYQNIDVRIEYLTFSAGTSHSFLLNTTSDFFRLDVTPSKY